MSMTVSKDSVGLHTLEVIAKADHFNEWMYNQFKHQLKGNVLEIGGGIGNISKFVIKDAYSITLSDFNEEYCGYLKEKFSHYENVKGIISIDLLHPQFENKYTELKEKFDSIFLLNVIEHIERDQQAVENCNYLLKSNGHLILLAPAYPWLFCSFDKQLGHYRRYTSKSLKELLKKENLSILSDSYFNFLGIAGWFLFGKIFNKKMLGNNEMSAFNRLVPVAKFFDALFLKKIGLSVIITGIKN